MSGARTVSFLSGPWYDRLKFVAQILLPAIGTLYFTIAQIWGLPNAEEVVGSITAVDAFLGVILGLSTYQYNRSDEKYVGALVIRETENKKIFSIDLVDDPENLEANTEVLLKVVNR